MNNHQTEKIVNEMWHDSIIPELCEFIKIPNEFLHIETGKRLTCCVAEVLEDHMNR